MAMESGLPPEVLQEMFSRPARFRYGRMIHIVDAGESLLLAGLAVRQVQQIMDECIDRDLTGTEVERVVNVFQDGVREGKDFETLHASLWIPSGTAHTEP